MNLFIIYLFICRRRFCAVAAVLSEKDERETQNNESRE